MLIGAFGGCLVLVCVFCPVHVLYCFNISCILYFPCHAFTQYFCFFFFFVHLSEHLSHASEVLCNCMCFLSKYMMVFLCVYELHSVCITRLYTSYYCAPLRVWACVVQVIGSSWLAPCRLSIPDCPNFRISLNSNHYLSHMSTIFLMGTILIDWDCWDICLKQLQAAENHYLLYQIYWCYSQW